MSQTPQLNATAQVLFRHSITGEGSSRFCESWQRINAVAQLEQDTMPDEDEEPTSSNPMEIRGKHLLRPINLAEDIDNFNKSGVTFMSCPLLSESATIVQPVAFIEEASSKGDLAPFGIDRVLCTLRHYASNIEICNRYCYSLEGKKLVRYLILNLMALHEKGYYFPQLSIKNIFVVSYSQGSIKATESWKTDDEIKVKKAVINLKLEELDLRKSNRLSFYYAYGTRTVVDNETIEGKQQEDWRKLSLVLRDLRTFRFGNDLKATSQQSLGHENEMINLEDQIMAYGLGPSNIPALEVLCEHPSMWSTAHIFSYMTDLLLNRHNLAKDLSHYEIYVTWPDTFKDLKDRLEECTEGRNRDNVTSDVENLILLLRNIYAHYDDLDSHCQKLSIRVDNLILERYPLLFVLIWNGMRTTVPVPF